MRRLAAAVLVTLIGGWLPATAADDENKPRRSTEQPLADFDAGIAKGLKAHGVPGLGIAIVKDGKVVLAKGYGVRTTGQTDPVTEKTLFAIGSVSKSFTAASIAMLVDEGKLKWDDTLVSKLKDFRLPDDYLSQEVTLRDALSHRVGIARNELIWYGSPFDRDTILHKLRDVKPGSRFRTRFVYNNILYMAAGQVIPQVANKSWDDFVAERVFKPLNMTTANTSVRKLPKDGDVATPHEKAKGIAKAIPWKDIDNIGPAGSINASPADMAEYVKFQLARGKGPEKRLVKREVFDDMHTPQMLIPGGSFFNPNPHLHAYGFGWMLADYKGKKVVEHGGNIDGMTAQVGMLPDEKLGVVVLANLGGSLLPQAVMYEVFDRFLGEPASNRLEATGFLIGLSEFGVQRMAEPAESSRIKDTKPSLPLDKYAGKYEDTLHAPLKVTCEKEKLSLVFNGLTFDLDHWHYDTFRGTERRGVLPRMLFTFALGSDGKVAEIGSKVFGDDIRLKRKVD
jgi:CubicO group peptidase (beta-lactamase class C family)